MSLFDEEAAAGALHAADLDAVVAAGQLDLVPADGPRDRNGRPSSAVVSDGAGNRYWTQEWNGDFVVLMRGADGQELRAYPVPERSTTQHELQAVGGRGGVRAVRLIDQQYGEDGIGRRTIRFPEQEKACQTQRRVE